MPEAKVLDARSSAVDALILSRWTPMPGAALLAVGGYGRRELFPYSDIDLLLLVDSEARTHDIREPFAAFQQGLWDAGLRLSPSVRTLEECLRVHPNNAELNISLLDQRFLTGDESLHGQLVARLPTFLQRRRRDILHQLSRLTRERHAKFQETVYHLEPNIKDGAGGLRDFQVVRWTVQLTGGNPPAPSLVEAAAYLGTLRKCLHELSHRDNNILNFEAQDHIAALEQTTPAAVMREYFRSARSIRRACLAVLEAEEEHASPLFANLRDRWSRLSNADFSVVRGKLYLRAPQLARSDWELVLRLFAFVARHGTPLAAETGRRLAEFLPALTPILQNQPGLWHRFREVLVLPHTALALDEMHQSGVLRAIFPEWGDIECLVVRDFFHQYTVDEHSLVAIRNLLALPQQTKNHFAEIARENSSPDLLITAILFHDMGKGTPDQDHVIVSRALALPALNRIGMPERDIETVLFLIDAHLVLSAAMNGRDLADPATAMTLAQRVGTVERLKLLTLFTYVDSSAVNATPVTPWRSSLLWQTYQITYRELTRELDADRIHTSLPGDFLEGFPTRYQLTHSQAEIEQHVQLEEQSRQAGAAVKLQKTTSAYKINLVTRDRPFLFASVAGAISSFGMDILKAEAFGNAHGVIIETFTFADPLRTLELNPSESERLERLVLEAALGRVDVARLVSGRRPPVQKHTPEPTRVSIDQESSATATLIQLVAEDRPGLLYDLAFAMSSERCNIEVVLINTEARKAIDVFYVTHEGGKLPPALAERLTQTLKQL